MAGSLKRRPTTRQAAGCHRTKRRPRRLLENFKGENVTSETDAMGRPMMRTNEVAMDVGADFVVGAIILSMALVIGLATASDFGMTIDEFNTDDYGPKA